MASVFFIFAPSQSRVRRWPRTAQFNSAAKQNRCRKK